MQTHVVCQKMIFCNVKQSVFFALNKKKTDREKEIGRQFTISLYDTERQSATKKKKKIFLSRRRRRQLQPHNNNKIMLYICIHKCVNAIFSSRARQRWNKKHNKKWALNGLTRIAIKWNVEKIHCYATHRSVNNIAQLFRIKNIIYSCTHFTSHHIYIDIHYIQVR